MSLPYSESVWSDESSDVDSPVARPLWDLHAGGQSFREVAGRLPAGIFIANTRGDVLYANEAFTALVGIDAVAGRVRDWRAVLHPEDRASTLSAWQQALAEGSSFEREFRLRRGDGAKRWVLCRAVPQRSADGAKDGYMGTVTDITIRRRNEELVAGQNRTLQLLLGGAPWGTVLGELAQTVEREHDHEVVAAILLLSADQRRLQHGAAPSLPAGYNAAIDGLEIGPTIGTCAAAAARNETVITCDIANDPGWSAFKQLPLELGLVAAWSLPIRGSKGEVLGTFGTYFRTRRLARTEMPTERIELGSFIAGIVESYPQFDAAHAKIEFAVPLAAVRANPAALTQCVSNLLDNAIKFVGPGVQPHVRIWTETSPGGPVRLFFRDNAVGIPDSLVQKVFGTFYQIDPSRGGTGIGLAVVRKAAERMGESVSVVSEPGKGSTFQLELKPARKT